MLKLAHLYQDQGLVLDTLAASSEFEHIDLIMAKGLKVLNAHLEAFVQLEATLIGQV